MPKQKARFEKVPLEIVKKIIGSKTEETTVDEETLAKKANAQRSKVKNPQEIRR
jgi:hypothetical protein